MSIVSSNLKTLSPSEIKKLNDKNLGGKKVTGNWNIFAPKRYARIYLLEEFGNVVDKDHFVDSALSRMARDSRGWVDLTDTPSFCQYAKKTKVSATEYATRIIMMIAFAEGRDGKPLTGGGGLICPSKKW